MSLIRWTNNGVFADGKKLRAKDLIDKLYYSVVFDGVLLRNVVSVVKNDLDRWHTCLQLQALPMLLKEAGQLRSRRKQSVDKLVLSWHAESWTEKECKNNALCKNSDVKKTRKINRKKTTDFFLYLGLSGLLNNENMPYSMSFVNINKMINTPIVIDPAVIIYKNGNEGQYIGDMNPTVLDVFRSTFYDLTFYGPPSARDDRLKKLDTILKQYTS